MDVTRADTNLFSAICDLVVSSMRVGSHGISTLLALNCRRNAIRVKLPGWQRISPIALQWPGIATMI